MTRSPDIGKLLRPEAREALQHLELYARRTVDGTLHGIHRSRRKGVSSDFDHHQNYLPGDPLKHVDWKASARHDRLYVKRHMEDTALTVRLVVDGSGSMRRTSNGSPSKYLQAARLSACLAYLVVKEHDRVGLTVAVAGQTVWLPAGSGETHLVRILQTLAAHDGEATDSLDACLRAVLERNERRGLVAVVSDLMLDPVPVRQQLSRLHAQGHEVLLFHLRDPGEEDFPFNRWVEFRNLEVAGARLRLDTVPLKRLYREEYQALAESWRQWTRKYGMHLLSVRTDEAMETCLSDYIFRRAEMGR
ncbi:MAG: hypothetical protein BWZ02_01092 [Lentisphaerae bacterium ADurb.BinA184]|nr:MAG: hypothetical protein BWZ02_01092 [Lentisphaerae bacterium ADurb.BinA184]